MSYPGLNPRLFRKTQKVEPGGVPEPLTADQPQTGQGLEPDCAYSKAAR
jgi:hypothetical protein